VGQRAAGKVDRPARDRDGLRPTATSSLETPATVLGNWVWSATAGRSRWSRTGTMRSSGSRRGRSLVVARAVAPAGRLNARSRALSTARFCFFGTLVNSPIFSRNVPWGRHLPTAYEDACGDVASTLFPRRKLLLIAAL